MIVIDPDSVIQRELKKTMLNRAMQMGYWMEARHWMRENGWLPFPR